MKIEIHTLKDTERFAQKMAGLCKGHTLVITLDGDLGAGKTTWTQFFGKALGIQTVINSPTFTIMKSYKQADGQPFYHMDAYRLEGMHQDLGFEECFDQGISVVEWASYIEEQLPQDRIDISWEEKTGEERLVTCRATGSAAQKILEAYDD